MKQVMLTEHQLKEIAKTLSKFYPYKSKDIYLVMLQTKNIDATINIIHHCTMMAYKLDYGVYCYLKYKDSEHERM